VNRLILFFAAIAVLRADSIEDILKRMDAASKTFQSFTAKLKQVEYTDVLHETSESSGEIRVKRSKNGMTAVVIFTAPESKMMHFAGRNAEIYYPKAKTLEIYDVGKYQGAMDRWIALGFGTSGAELRKDYDIKLGAPQKLNGVDTTVLELTPRSAEVQKLATRIDMWITEGKYYPAQVKALQPSKNYLLLIYSDVKINPPLTNADFELKLPPDVRKIHPSR
jgi:outer membrane lipoprotein-sorting protein